MTDVPPTPDRDDGVRAALRQPIDVSAEVRERHIAAALDAAAEGATGAGASRRRWLAPVSAAAAVVAVAVGVGSLLALSDSDTSTSSDVVASRAPTEQSDGGGSSNDTDGVDSAISAGATEEGAEFTAKRYLGSFEDGDGLAAALSSEGASLTGPAVATPDVAEQDPGASGPSAGTAPTDDASPEMAEARAPEPCPLPPELLDSASFAGTATVAGIEVDVFTLAPTSPGVDGPPELVLLDSETCQVQP